jgi:hypothetical protein
MASEPIRDAPNVSSALLAWPPSFSPSAVCSRLVSISLAIQN